jgi:hypothetical protein
MLANDAAKMTHKSSFIDIKQPNAPYSLAFYSCPALAFLVIFEAATTLAAVVSQPSGSP